MMGDRQLDTEDLHTGLGVTLKRLDTGSAWVLINNPHSKYWNTPADRGFLGNRNYRLAQIVRASTATSDYFDPQEIPAIADGVQGLFVDGGLTPHNNPSLAMFLAAYVPTHGPWLAGRGRTNLTIVSVEAGTFRDRFETQDFQPGRIGASGAQGDDPADRRQSATGADPDVAIWRKPDSMAD